MTSWQCRARGSETRPAPPTHIEQHVLRSHVRRDDLQVGVEAAVRVIAVTLRRLATPAVVREPLSMKAGALSIDGVHMGCVLLGCGHHCTPHV
jgi:hypothetical protein